MANLFFFQGPCEDGKQIVDVTNSSKLMEKHVLGSACLKHFCPGENQVSSSSSSSRDNNNCNIGCLTISYDKTVMTDDDIIVACSTYVKVFPRPQIHVPYPPCLCFQIRWETGVCVESPDPCPDHVLTHDRDNGGFSCDLSVRHILGFERTCPKGQEIGPNGKCTPVVDFSTRSNSNSRRTRRVAVWGNNSLRDFLEERFGPIKRS